MSNGSKLLTVLSWLAYELFAMHDLVMVPVVAYLFYALSPIYGFGGSSST
jgi:hypothetical protein